MSLEEGIEIYEIGDGVFGILEMGATNGFKRVGC